MKARLSIVIALMIVSALALAACGPSATSETATVEATQSGPAVVGQLTTGEGTPSGPAAAGGTATLEGTQWELVSYVTAANETVDVLPGTVITSLFNRGQVDGRGSCNDYAGSYVLSGEKLAVKVGGTTQKFCSPEELMGQEKIFLGDLNNAASYKISGNRLEIYDEGGLVLLTYRVLEASPLVGTTWGLITYNNGKEALVSSLAGTDITAVFGADGKVTGSAGCNTYNAAYQVDGLKISIGPVATTRMACAEPAGIMEQETAYLAALQTAIRYEIEGDELVLWNSEGTHAAEFIAR